MNRKNGSFWNIGCCLGAILLSPIFLVILILHMLYTPIDFILYISSDYRKDTKQGYVWLVSTSKIFKLYRLIKSEGLSIDYYQIPSTTSACGYLIANSVLIDYDSLVFLGEDNRWYINVENRDQRLRSVEDITLTEFEEAHSFRPAKVVYLIDKGEFGEEEVLKQAELEPSFFLYEKKKKGSLIEALRSIIAYARSEEVATPKNVEDIKSEDVSEDTDALEQESKED